jgi:hypothetical protein
MLTDTEKARRFDLMLDYVKRLEATYSDAVAHLRADAKLVREQIEAMPNPCPERSKFARTFAGCNAKAKVYGRCANDLRFVIRKNEYER